MTTSVRFAKSQDPYHSDWVAMGLAPAPVATKPKRGPRVYAKPRYIKLADREKAITEFKSTHLNLGPLSESPEAKAKTAKLIGRTNGARTQ